MLLTVNVRVVPLVGFILDVARVDRDAARLLLGCLSNHVEVEWGEGA